jgi:uncharacterized protein with FMN-binding domain
MANLKDNKKTNIFSNFISYLNDHESYVKWLGILVCVLLMIAFYFINLKRQRITELSKLEFKNTQIETVADGTYFGKCKTSFMYVEVEVCVKDGRFEKISIVDSKGFKGKNAELILDNMVKENKILVSPIEHEELYSIVFYVAVDDAVRKGCRRSKKR